MDMGNEQKYREAIRDVANKVSHSMFQFHSEKFKESGKKRALIFWETPKHVYRHFHKQFVECKREGMLTIEVACRDDGSNCQWENAKENVNK